MVIAFFPGAGGNRYLQYLLSNDWKKHGISYDVKNQGQLFENRYLLSDTTDNNEYILTHCLNSSKIQSVFPDKEIIFIKSDLKQSLKREWMLHGHARYAKKQIESVFPRVEHYQAYRSNNWPVVDSEEQLDCLPANILKEVTEDYKKLQYDTVNGPDTLTQLTKECIGEINSAYEIIKWHQQYYQNYAIDLSLAKQVIDIDTSDDEFAILMRVELSLYQNTIFDRVWDKINE
jgi:hypothetical protein